MPLSPNVIVFTWNPPPYEDQNGEIILYNVSVELTGAPDIFMIQFETAGESITFNDLKPYTNHTFSVAAWTSIGIGPFDNITVVTPQSSKYKKV